MENMVDRFKEARKAAGLSQKELAEKLCMTQAHISAMEKGIRDITDRTISDICRELGVNETWIRSGQGKMFAAGSVAPSIVTGLAQEYDLDLMDQNLIAEYLKLDKQSREVLKGYIRRVFLASDEEAAIREEVASYEAELRAEKGEKSSASGTTNAKEA